MSQYVLRLAIDSAAVPGIIVIRQFSGYLSDLYIIKPLTRSSRCAAS